MPGGGGKPGRVGTPLERFMRKVEQTDGGCWLWTGARKKPDGYGNFYLDGRYVGAHVFAYTSFVGPVPDGTEIDHECNVKPCVRPDHLEAVPHAVNIERSYRRDGRLHWTQM